MERKSNKKVEPGLKIPRPLTYSDCVETETKREPEKTMKTFDSASFDYPVSGNRTEAIRQAINFLTRLIKTSDVTPHARYTWRASDESGFTIQIKETTGGYVAVCVNKWNAARW